MWLAIRMYLLLAVLFGIVYALIVVVGSFLGVGNFLVYAGLAIVMMLVQYAIGPKMVEWTMKVRYVSGEEEPWLHRTVEDLAQRAGVPKPKVGIAQAAVPNAFAFGRSRGGSRICVTEGIRQLLSKEELRAVLGHEVSHIKNRDVMFITIISVIPTIAWYIAWSTMFSRDRDGGGAALGMIAFIIYFITNLLVLYGSRIREYAADKGSVALGEQPHDLASALYKLVYGSARLSKQQIKGVEGMKAFFATDPSRAARELTDLRVVDKDMSGTIDRQELKAIREKEVRTSRGDRLFEILSTHPNMLRRIFVLSSYKSVPRKGDITVQ